MNSLNSCEYSLICYQKNWFLVLLVFA
jgi:hypothetical protein